MLRSGLGAWVLGGAAPCLDANVKTSLSALSFNGFQRPACKNYIVHELSFCGLANCSTPSLKTPARKQDALRKRTWNLKRVSFRSTVVCREPRFRFHVFGPACTLLRRSALSINDHRKSSRAYLPKTMVTTPNLELRIDTFGPLV